MNALFAPVSPLATAIADVFVSAHSAIRRFLNSDCMPTWTEYLRDCDKD